MEHKKVQELRWDPVLGEWVMVSNIRDLRPWQPQSFCPFCPGAPETGVGWDVLILKNRFPMLSEEPILPEKHEFYSTAPSYGKCYVVIETPKHDIDDISDLSTAEIYRVLESIKKKQEEEMVDPKVVYFLFFRNKGKEIGVSLTHPHSQIYVTPFIPSKILRELINSNKYYSKKRRCLFCDIINVERNGKERTVAITDHWIAFLPFYAHWPFEVHIYPLTHVQVLPQLNSEVIEDMARIVRKVLCGIKKVFEKPMPYMMTLHQAPLRGTYKFYHMHIEIYGIYRVVGKLKYAAGMETGGGNFTYDSTPEEAAHILRNIIDTKCEE
ncbi:MAG: galactose-1-phosphate uridylyltransferase [Ignisphaera sp.]|nr:galactose-1-phosphate uridylyltransferase [Ignisphaera sp.]MCX8167790.1 galactose-1-phosphate uridylyltransferase [Ignisphaera sp.]MDW8085223.1 galactose-1-phosphate uridylyltransferase [Ignisphaera sp.]